MSYVAEKTHLNDRQALLPVYHFTNNPMRKDDSSSIEIAYGRILVVAP